MEPTPHNSATNLCQGQLEVLGTAVHKAKSLSSRNMHPSGGEDQWEVTFQEISAVEGRKSAVERPGEGPTEEGILS